MSRSFSPIIQAVAPKISSAGPSINSGTALQGGRSIPRETLAPIEEHLTQTFASPEKLAPPGASPGTQEAQARHVADTLPPRRSAPVQRAPVQFDFSSVRIFADLAADQLARRERALAFTQRESIVFRAGQYDLQGERGRRLLTHELVHVAQQRLRGPALQRSDDPVSGQETRTYSIIVPRGVSTFQQLSAYAETVIFGKVVGLNWTFEPASEDYYTHIGDHVGDTISVNVAIATLVAQGVTPGANGASPGGSGQGASSVGELPADVRASIYSETDRRYYEATGDEPGSQIKTGEHGKIVIWRAFLREVMADRAMLDALPDTLKELMNAEATFTPENYDTLVRIADLLEAWSAEDLADYKSKVTGSTYDLLALEASLSAYWAQRQQREAARESREGLASKLTGLETVYALYRAYASSREEERAPAPVGPMTGTASIRPADLPGFKEKMEHQRQDLLAALSQYNFSSIEEFEALLDDYESAFLTETVAITEDLMLQAEHQLYEAEKRYAPDSEVDALLGAVQGSSAPGQLASSKSELQAAQDARDQASFWTVQGAQDRSNDLSDASARHTKQAEADLADADATVRDLADTYPLLGDTTFPRTELINADRDKARELINDHLEAQRGAIRTLRDRLRANPRVAYKLPDLLALSKDRQHIAASPILSSLISDRQAAFQEDVADLRILLAAAGLLLAIVTLATGPIGAVAAVAAFGLGATEVVLDFREYELQASAYELGLASDDPSLGWLILSAVGAAADMAGAFEAVRLIRLSPALEVLEETKDIVRFESELAKIKELKAEIRASVVAAGEAKLGFERALSSLSRMVAGQANVLIPGMIDPRWLPDLIAAAWYGARRGITEFRIWLAELQGAKIIDDAASLSAEERAILLEAWTRGLNASQNAAVHAPALKTAIQEYRTTTGVSRTRNAMGKVEGGTAAAAKAEIDGLPDEIVKGGSPETRRGPARSTGNNPRYQSPQSFGGTKNHAEQNVLGDIADKIDAAKSFAPSLKGVPKPEVKGTIYMHVEQAVCSSCRQGLASSKDLGVVGQFSKEYPNVVLVITNAETSEVLIVGAGKALTE